MKKLVLIVAVAFGASMVACSSSEKANDAENAAEATEVVENVEVAEVAATPDTVRINENQIVVNGDTIENTTWVAAEVVEVNTPNE